MRRYLWLSWRYIEDMTFSLSRIRVCNVGRPFKRRRGMRMRVDRRFEKVGERDVERVRAGKNKAPPL